MKTKHTHYVYCICYVENKYYQHIDKDLHQYNRYVDDKIKAIIPTVNILKKTVKGKPIYEKVPILFSYGFIKMPLARAYSREYLNRMKREIPGIRGWVKSTETLHPRKKKLRVDNMDIFDDFSIVATATRKEIRHLKRLSKDNKRFSIDNLNLKVGDYLVLRGYPFEGVDANILDINHTTKKVKLLLYPENGKMEISLPFDNVIYSVYNNYDPDKLLVNSTEYDPSLITESAIKDMLDLKQY